MIYKEHSGFPWRDASRANKDPWLIYAASKPEKYAHKGIGYDLKRIQNQTVSQTGYHVTQKTGKAHKATKLTKRQAIQHMWSTIVNKWNAITINK